MVLPAPVGPSNTTNAPSSMVSERSDTAGVAPKRFDTPSSDTSDMGVLHRWSMVMERRANGVTGSGVEQRDAVRAKCEPNGIADGHFDSRRRVAL